MGEGHTKGSLRGSVFLEKESNLPLVQNSADRSMSGFPYMELVDENDVGKVCVVYMFKKSDLHFSQRGGPA